MVVVSKMGTKSQNSMARSDHNDHIWSYNIWLVVYLPLWKIWVRQLGWWNNPNIWKNIKCSKPPSFVGWFITRQSSMTPVPVDHSWSTPGSGFTSAMSRLHQWIALRENLNLKQQTFPWNMWFSCEFSTNPLIPVCVRFLSCLRVADLLTFGVSNFCPSLKSSHFGQGLLFYPFMLRSLSFT